MVRRKKFLTRVVHGCMERVLREKKEFLTQVVDDLVERGFGK